MARLRLYGSITYEEGYRMNIFPKFEIVWDKIKNKYYLNDCYHKNYRVSEIYDREDDFFLISGENIIKHFFKNIPSFSK